MAANYPTLAEALAKPGSGRRPLPEQVPVHGQLAMPGYLVAAVGRSSNGAVAKGVPVRARSGVNFSDPQLWTFIIGSLKAP